MHLVYVVLEIIAFAAAVGVAGFLYNWFCYVGNEACREEEVEVRFEGSLEVLVIKIIGNNEDFPEEGQVVYAQEVVADGS